MIRKTLLLILICLTISCIDKDSNTYTLYRESVVIPNARIHVATFDSKENSSTDSCNKENCETAKILFETQPGVLVKYFCEKGKYRK